MDPRQTAIRLSKLRSSTAISDLTEEKLFTLSRAAAAGLGVMKKLRLLCRALICGDALHVAAKQLHITTYAAPAAACLVSSVCLVWGA